MKQFQKNGTGFPLEGSIRIKFLNDANATHFSSFKHTPTPVLHRLYVSLSIAKLQAIEYFLQSEPIRIHSSAFISLQILIAFATNPTYAFSVPSDTRRVCRSLLKKCKEQDSNSFSTSRTSQTKIARDVSHTLRLRLVFRQNATISI